MNSSVSEQSIPKTTTSTELESQINILGLNVGNLLSKLKFDILQNYINNFDIVCLGETMLDEADEYNVNQCFDDYMVKYKHRSEFERKKNIIQICS